MGTAPRSIIVLPGTAENYVWSLIDYGRRELSSSYQGTPPPETLRVKSPEQILWAFNRNRLYDELRSSVIGGREVFVVLVSNGTSYFSRGVIGFGTINENDLKGETEWDYWPSGEGWDYKFFIKIDKLAPTVLKSLEKIRENRSYTIRDFESIYKEWADSIFPLIPGNVAMGQRFIINFQTYNLLKKQVEHFWRRWEVKKAPSSLKPQDLLSIIKIHLVSGKNVIIYGPPGVGKTTFAKKVCSQFASGYNCVTGNPEWTVYDVIGGFRLGQDKYQKGFLTDAVLLCWKSLVEDGKPYWLLLDEINRTNVDLSFGKAFTLMDIMHREAEELLESEIVEKFEDNSKYYKIVSEKLFMPYSFRIVGTMNSYDRALLFKLGFALIRRFSLIPMGYKPFSIPETLSSFQDKAVSFMGRYEGEFQGLIERAREELQLNREEYNDFAVIERNYFDVLINGSIDQIIDNFKVEAGFSPFELINSICSMINEEFKDIIEIGPGLAMDATKFLISAFLVLWKENVENYINYLLDESIAAYILPQLDFLSDKIRAEKMGITTGGELSSKLTTLIDEFKGLNLTTRSIPLLEKLRKGERII